MTANKRPIRKQKSFTIGIDLGTTNSCVALVEDGRPQVLLNAAGARTTPSVVSWYRGTEYVGKAAKSHSTLAPESVLFSVKRIIGRRMADPKVAAFSERTRISAVEGADGDARVVVEFMNDGQRERKILSPVEISAKVLTEMKGAAERHLGKKVTDAVITVPAYFNDAQRKATMDAGKIAGLNVKRIVNEPTAAAFAYGLDKNKSGTIIVYDLGGGTFDVSVLRITGGIFEVVATDGDNYLGGDDVDSAIVGHLAELCLRQHGQDPRREPLAHARVREAAEQAKIELSWQKYTEITLPFLFNGINFQATLTRRELERAAAPLVTRSIDICKRLLQDTKLRVSDIDHLLLVGGMTRMPLVQEATESLFGRKPSLDVNPDEVVALGAAVQGAVLDQVLDDILLMDITPLSLGCGLRGDIFSRVIERNTVIPTAGKRPYTTVEDDQSSVYFQIYQGEREIASENYLLGTMVLDGIPPAPRGVPNLEVTFGIDENGVLSASARDQASGRSCSIRIDNTGLLAPEEIDKMVREAAANTDKDRQRRRLAEQRNFLEDWIHDANKAVSAMDADQARGILKNIAEVQDALITSDPIKIERVWTWLSRSSRM